MRTSLPVKANRLSAAADARRLISGITGRRGAVRRASCASSSGAGRHNGAAVRNTERGAEGRASGAAGGHSRGYRGAGRDASRAPVGHLP
jgi:hypothetical protein